MLSFVEKIVQFVTFQTKNISLENMKRKKHFIKTTYMLSMVKKAQKCFHLLDRLDLPNPMEFLNHFNKATSPNLSHYIFSGARQAVKAEPYDAAGADRVGRPRA